MITVITPIIKTKKYNNRYRKSKASWQFPRGAENSYFVLMKNILKNLKKAVEEYLPKIEQQVNASPFIIKNDDMSDDMDELRRILEQYTDNPMLNRRVKDIADAIYKNDQRQLEKAFRSAMKVDIYASFPELSQLTDLWVKSNISLIKSVPNVYVGNLSSVVINGVQQGRTYADMAEEIQKAYDITENKALFWARDQTAKLNGNITKHMQTQAGADKYEWSTSHDNRVRDTHRDREGRIYNWTGTENRPDGLDPGEEYNCRCVALPVFDLMDVEKNVAGMDNIEYPKDDKDDIIKANKIDSYETAKVVLENRGVIFDSSLMKIEEQLLVENSQKLNDLLDRFPQAQAFVNEKQLVFKASDIRKDFIGCCQYKIDGSGQTILLNPKFFSSHTEYINSQLKQSKENWKMPLLKDKASTYTMSHEFGHYVQNIIFEKIKSLPNSGWDETLSRARMQRTTQAVKKIINSWYKTNANAIKKDIIKNAKKLDKSINSKNYLDFLSDYGKKSPQEFFAECFANMESGAPNILGDAMREYLKGEFD